MTSDEKYRINFFCFHSPNMAEYSFSQNIIKNDWIKYIENFITNNDENFPHLRRISNIELENIQPETVQWLIFKNFFGILWLLFI